MRSVAIPVPQGVRRALATPRANTATGGLLIAAAVLLFALVGWLDDALATGVPDAVAIPLALGLVSVLVLAGLILLAQPARWTLPRAAILGAGAYLAVGLVLGATGLADYVDPGTWYLVVAWPTYILWLHPCTLGAGLWPCPSG